MLQQEIHELRTEVASVRTQVQTMEEVIASLLVKLSASHGWHVQQPGRHLARWRAPDERKKPTCSNL